MQKKIFITGMGSCRETPRSIETIRPVKTVIKAEELALSATAAAFKQALDRQTVCQGQAGLTPEGDSLGIIFGIDNAIEGCKRDFFHGLLHDGPLGVSPLLFPFTSPNAITAQVTIAFGIKGESATITNGPLSFLKAIEYGLELLNQGVIQSALIGGVSEHEAMVIVAETHTRQENAQKSKYAREPFNQKDLSTILNAGKGITSIEDSFAIIRGVFEKKVFAAM